MTKCIKVGHSSLEAANNVIARAWAGHGFQGTALPVRAYLCQCKKWHLTSKPLMTKEELRKQKAGA